MLPQHPNFTITASLLALLSAALIWFPGRQRWPRVVVFLIIGGVGGLAASKVGQWARHGVAWVEHAINNLIGALFGVAVAWLIALAAVAFVAAHLYHKTINRGTLAYSAAVPLTVTLVPGAIGTLLISAAGLVTWVCGWVFYYAFHPHAFHLPHF
jgi:hypothetical protein